MKTCVVAITNQGLSLGKKIAAELPDCVVESYDGDIARTLASCWRHYEGILCIMAAGIVVRSIAPLVADKSKDPCVLVLDQQGRYCISLLSGHIGGGNALASRVAAITGGDAVITTASDNLGKCALDLWAARNNVVISDKVRLTQLTAEFVNGRSLALYREHGLPGLPEGLLEVSSPEDADIIIAAQPTKKNDALCCIAKNLYVGVGCNRGTPLEVIAAAFADLCQRYGISREAIAGVSSIDLKNDEAGIIDFAKSLGHTPQFYDRDMLNNVPDISVSEVVLRNVGAKGVAEPAAILAASQSGAPALLRIPKQKWKDVTLAVAERVIQRWA